MSVFACGQNLLLVGKCSSVMTVTLIGLCLSSFPRDFLLHKVSLFVSFRSVNTVGWMTAWAFNVKKCSQALPKSLHLGTA